MKITTIEINPLTAASIADAVIHSSECAGLDPTQKDTIKSAIIKILLDRAACEGHTIYGLKH
ncbi:hypothetical protein HGA64_05400 [Candidatus Falkowbacteria bacterium]|nr:hypothetical protein [Candidatus Falkowbacteria bacterium]